MKRAFVLPVVLLASWWTAAATTVIPMSVEELTHAATQVLEGRALHSWSAWNPQHTLIYTYTTFAVRQTLKGANADSVVVKQIGGSAGGYTQRVAGVHQYQAGEKALLFLRPSIDADGTLVVVGLMQGSFREYQTEAGTTMVSNGVPGVLRYQNGRVDSFAPAAMRLDDAESRVRKALP